MKYLILVRHGDYEYPNGNLTGTGARQMNSIGHDLSHLKDVGRVEIRCSPIARVSQSADQFKKWFDVMYLRDDLLKVESGDMEDPAGQISQIIEMIKINTADVLILVTHNPILLRLPRAVAIAFGFPETGEIPEFDLASAMIIDFKDGHQEMVRSQD